MSVVSSSAYICSTCMRRAKPLVRWPQYRRLNTSKTPVPSAAFAPLRSRRLISLHGVDAPKYLQGLISANVPRPSSKSQSGFYSAFLNAAGRVLHDVFIYPIQRSERWQEKAPSAEQGEGFLIEVDANEVDALYKHLKRYKLRAKIGIRMINAEEWLPWSAWGASSVAGDMSCSDDRVPGGMMGSRVIQHGDDKPFVDAEEVAGATYTLRRILLGVPEGQTEIIKESALPQESNIDYMGGIDFRKGCYVGQELTIRTHHTGVVRKRILPVQLYDVQEKQPLGLSYDPNANIVLPPPGANISRVGKKGRSAGKWLGGVANVGLALCRLEIMTDIVLTGESSHCASDDEFKVTWEEESDGTQREIKVKAFVPEWHREREEAQRVQRPNG